jgi:hypothetical protein
MWYILNNTQPYRPPRPVMGMALPFAYYVTYNGYFNLDVSTIIWTEYPCSRAKFYTDMVEYNNRINLNMFSLFTFYEVRNCMALCEVFDTFSACHEWWTGWHCILRYRHILNISMSVYLKKYIYWAGEFPFRDSQVITWVKAKVPVSANCCCPLWVSRQLWV